LNFSKCESISDTGINLMQNVLKELPSLVSKFIKLNKTFL
jgi:hypothetical protein